jgi:hypothetical protein
MHDLFSFFRIRVQRTGPVLDRVMKMVGAPPSRARGRDLADATTVEKHIFSMPFEARRQVFGTADLDSIIAKLM